MIAHSSVCTRTYVVAISILFTPLCTILGLTQVLKYLDERADGVAANKHVLECKKRNVGESLQSTPV